MSGSRFRYLFSPLQLGPLKLKNRVIFSAHLTNYASQDGMPTDQHAAYYAARAKGGAGLIITEEHSVHRTDWPYEKMIHAFKPEVVPGYRKITDAVHAHGVPILAQINHNGGQASSMYSRLPVWAPSAVPDPMFREVPKALSKSEIDEVVASYAEVAARCIEGGFDGIELQCSHSSIVRGFLSPATNIRTDSYGGSLTNRTRILHEIVAAVREAIGPDLVLGVRLCGDELIPGGTTIDDAVQVAKAVDEVGQVDYINTSIGVATQSLFMIEASMHIPPNYAMFIPSAIRDAVDVPVVGVGRFKDALQAERALAEGHADLIGVVRGQIADPDFVAKARSGRDTETRLCLSCNQECVGRMGLNRWLGCIENPDTGREQIRLTHKQPPPRPGTNITIIGGGPAGLQAAVSAAKRGFKATVFEAQDQLGGQVRLAASVPARAEFGDLVRNLIAEAQRLGVTINTGLAATPDLIEMTAPDAVVVATGSRPSSPWWVNTEAPNVADVTEVLDGTKSPSGSVVIIDELGFHHATSVAELLADRGCQVEIVTKGMVVAQDLGITLDMETWWLRATTKGIVQTTDRVAMGFDDGTNELQLLHHPTNTTETRNPDWLVLSIPAQPHADVYFQLKEISPTPSWSLHRIGDCLAPRRAHSAVIEGNRVIDQIAANLRLAV